MTRRFFVIKFLIRSSEKKKQEKDKFQTTEKTKVNLNEDCVGLEEEESNNQNVILNN